MKLGWGSNKQNTKAIVTVDLDGVQLCSINRVPVEERFSAPLESQRPVLSFADSLGTTYRHDLSSVVQEGFSWLHMSVRVHDGYACQADCLVHISNELAENSLLKGTVKGIRFQPFYLPQCKANPKELIGQGLFYRGLHFSGTVTPGNVSSSCICDYCGKSFRIQSFHTGFDQSAYFYCSNNPHTLITSAYIAGVPAPLSHPTPSVLSELESKLPPCKQCGGTFRYANPFLCPHCKRPFIDFQRHPEIRDNEYYGNYLYSERLQEWS